MMNDPTTLATNLVYNLPSHKFAQGSKSHLK